MQQSVITQNEITLRPFRITDAKELSRTLSDKELLLRLGANLPYPFNEADAVSFIKQVIFGETEYPLPPRQDFVIELAGEFIGSISLGGIEEGCRACLSYWIDRRYWGRGIATKAALALSAYGFRQFNLEYIYAWAYPDNLSSIRVLEKVGFDLYESKHTEDREEIVIFRLYQPA